jgi:hypothetical protein
MQPLTGQNGLGATRPIRIISGCQTRSNSYLGTGEGKLDSFPLSLSIESQGGGIA